MSQVPLSLHEQVTQFGRLSLGINYDGRKRVVIPGVGMLGVVCPDIVGVGWTTEEAIHDAVRVRREREEINGCPSLAPRREFWPFLRGG